MKYFRLTSLQLFEEVRMHLYFIDTILLRIENQQQPIRPHSTTIVFLYHSNYAANFPINRLGLLGLIQKEYLSNAHLFFLVCNRSLTLSSLQLF